MNDKSKSLSEWIWDPNANAALTRYYKLTNKYYNLYSGTIN